MSLCGSKNIHTCATESLDGRVSSKDKNCLSKCKDQLQIPEDWGWKGEVAQSKKPSAGEV